MALGFFEGGYNSQILGLLKYVGEAWEGVKISSRFCCRDRRARGTNLNLCWTAKVLCFRDVPCTHTHTTSSQGCRAREPVPCRVCLFFAEVVGLTVERVGIVHMCRGAQHASAYFQFAPITTESDVCVYLAQEKTSLLDHPSFLPYTRVWAVYCFKGIDSRKTWCRTPAEQPLGSKWWPSCRLAFGRLLCRIR